MNDESDDIFDNFDINELRDLFKIMQNEMNKLLRNQSLDKDSDFKSFIRGFSVSIGPDGVPSFKPIDNMTDEFITNLPDSISSNFNTPTFKHASEGWETPYTEIHIQSNNQYQIVSEVPGIKSVDVTINGRDLIFQGELGDRKYKKKIQLKNELDSDSLSWNIRNGVLEIIANYF